MTVQFIWMGAYVWVRQHGHTVAYIREQKRRKRRVYCVELAMCMGDPGSLCVDVRCASQAMQIATEHAAWMLTDEYRAGTGKVRDALWPQYWRYLI